MGHAKAYEDQGTPEEQSRRTFMANATLAIGGVIGLVLAVPLVTYIGPNKKVDELAGRQWSPIAEDDFKKLATADAPIKVSFTKRIVDAYYAPTSSDDYVWGVKMSDAQYQEMVKKRTDLFGPDGKALLDYPAMTAGYTIFSSVCPHLGCRFAWDTTKTKFFCPCHNSEFERNGEHIAGPAPRGLDPLPLREQSGKAEVTWIRYAASTPAHVIVSYA